ncbi:hypothetical protein AKJ09_05240 [Labilithrix luteola]|uniref:Long-chain-fatty-acyl-CoA reductase n=1 Tax=Labilithrix luteola TaxID=1391654 RepID=A0A0K1PYV1_9BACT|nr:acyl-CoA reductase [Labilithrix luteola]AKU98576.1 hypothetical protein AKJ09_05240 [Labilithrix luteola]
MSPRSVRDQAARVSDVKRLVDAARDVARNRGAIASELVAMTGLSPEGVDLAFEKHLELRPSDAEVASLVARAGDAPSVAVVLSANVFVGALRALAIARAASDDVIVRPSRREPVFARALVDAARALGDTGIRLDEAFEVASLERGEIHVYGRDETIDEVRKNARVRVRGHGSGMGVAWLSERAELESAARLLADDVVAFDQRGCLSPRVVMVEGDDARAEAFGEALHEALSRYDTLVPRGTIPADERPAAARYVDTMTYAGSAIVGAGHVVGVAPAGSAFVLPPSWRHVHVVPSSNAREAAAWLSPVARGVVTLGSNDLSAARALAGVVTTWARLAEIGRMQRPPLDGPVDLREF